MTNETVVGTVRVPFRWSLGLLMLAGACADTTIAGEMTGCYELQDGPWYTDSAKVDGAWTAAAPRRFQLYGDTLAAEQGASVGVTPMLVATALPDTGLMRFEYWQREAPGSNTILVGPLPGKGSLNMTLTLKGETLEGLVRVFTDVELNDSPSVETRPVVARRIACSPVN